jgi:uncharacterized damage-inducible protein DinB
MTTTTATTVPITDQERTQLLETLGKRREFLLHTVAGITEAQARSVPTVSELSLAGLLKHVAEVEQGWVDFIELGPTAKQGATPEAFESHAKSFQPTAEETLDVLRARYAAAAARTERVVVALDSLDLSHPLPEAPWFPPDTRWSARQVLLHIIGETSQHAGHADILREAIDGQKTMG